MDLRWQEEQRAFQARVLIEDEPELALRPYRTFVGAPTADNGRHATRTERLLVTIVGGAVLVAVMLAAGVPRELGALIASVVGGLALVAAVSPSHERQSPSGWTPLLAVYPASVLLGAEPVCVTQISVDEFRRLGPEGFGTVVGSPQPSKTFGLFVDDYLVWPRTPPRRADNADPRFGS